MHIDHDSSFRYKASAQNHWAEESAYVGDRKRALKKTLDKALPFEHIIDPSELSTFCNACVFYAITEGKK